MGRLRTLLTRRHTGLAPALIACALLLRLLVPAGWMPVTGADGLTRITLCTGGGLVHAWVDDTGAVHKEAPAKSGAHDQPCAFSGLSAALAFAELPAPILSPMAQATAAPALPQPVSIGHGLAAPPPPQTGPPLLA